MPSRSPALPTLPRTEAPAMNALANRETPSQSETSNRPDALSLPKPLSTGNGHHSSDRPIVSRLPKAKASTKARVLRAVAGVGLLALIFLVSATTWSTKFFGKPPYNGPTWTVPMEKLKVAIIERGALESAKNGDIICTVKSGAKGGAIATTIKWIIDPGVHVGKGDKLIELDSSGLVEQLKDQKIKVDQAKANWVTADEQYRIQESQNESDIETAKNAVDLAKIDLEKYEQGEFFQALEDVDGRIENARSDLDSWQSRSSWSAIMVRKGYQSKVQAESDAARVEAARFALRKVETEKRILTDFIKKRTIQDLTAKTTEAKRALDRVKSQSKSKLAQADADRMAKDSIYKQELVRKQEVEAEIAKCLVTAPQDGLVVYYVSDQMRGGGGAQQSIVAQGEPVREGQKLMQIPDLSQMVVNVRVHEAMVSTLRNEKDTKDRSAWQLAQIRIDAIPNRVLRGHVKTVDAVAAQQDWFSMDVKLYKTVVSIDEPVEGLKPGMSAEVTIYADESPTEVMIVPVQAIVGAISMGANPKCFVVGEDGQPEPRDLVVGLSNQRMVEVKSGLSVGEKVVLNPALLLADAGEAKPAKDGAKPQGDAQDTGAKKDKK